MKKKPPASERVPHPGEVLRSQFLQPNGMSVYELAKRTQVTRLRMNDIVLRRRSVTAETAIRLSLVLRTTPEFWMTLQAAYDLEEARRMLRRSSNVRTAVA